MNSSLAICLVILHPYSFVKKRFYNLPPTLSQTIFAGNSETNVPYQTRFHHKITGFDFQGQGYIHIYFTPISVRPLSNKIGVRDLFGRCHLHYNVVLVA